MTVSTIPDGYHTVTPWLISRDSARLIKFLETAFKAEPLGDPVYGENGSIEHAELRIGDSVVMLFDTHEDWPDTPAYHRLFLPDADAAMRRAIKAGGTVVTEMRTMAWGDRMGRVRDPFGNIWWIQTKVEDVDPAELGERFGQPDYVEAMQYFKTTLDEELKTR